MLSKKFHLAALLAATTTTGSACPFLNGNVDIADIADANIQDTHRELGNVIDRIKNSLRPRRTVPVTRAPTSAPTFAPTFKPTAVPTLQPITDPEDGFLSAPICLLDSVPVDATTMCAVAADVEADFNNLILGMSRSLKAQLFGASVRLAFHDAGEIDIRTGDSLGPDGCLQHITGENAGLVEVDQEVNSILEPIWQKYCNKISRADFWALWGKIVVESSATAPLSLDFYYGRVDNTECSLGSGRLPSADMGLAEIERVFVLQMGLTMDDAVTLIGAHSLGHMSTSFSGFGHPTTDTRNGALNFNSWDNDPDQLNNNFYRSLLNVPWVLDAATTAHGQDYIDNNSPRVMLNTDMSIGFVIDRNNDGLADAPRCGGGPPPPPQLRRSLQAGGGPPPCARQSSTMTLVDSYAADNQLFLTDFGVAFTKMTNVGYGYDDGTDVYTGKLGTLTKLVCPAA